MFRYYQKKTVGCYRAQESLKKGDESSKNDLYKTKGEQTTHNKLSKIFLHEHCNIEVFRLSIFNKMGYNGDSTSQPGREINTIK